VANTRPEGLISSMAVDPELAVAVLMSGGLDSAVLAVDLLRDHDRVLPLYIRGGLKWEEMELAAVQKFLAAVPAPGLEALTVLEEPLRDVYGPHWSTGAALVPEAGTPDEAVYLPGRNVLLTVKASVWCRLRRVGALALGCLDSNPFPDSTPGFFEDLESVLSRAMDGSPRLIRPFDRYLKRDVVLLGKELPLQLTFSCIDPVNEMHCGLCNKCAERQKGFQDAGIRDGTRYFALSEPSIRGDDLRVANPH
jgi:7-cyano-7-deazaguanine synthase